MILSSFNSQLLNVLPTSVKIYVRDNHQPHAYSKPTKLSSLVSRYTLKKSLYPTKR
jgi:hypothetical protein